MFTGNWIELLHLVRKCYENFQVWNINMSTLNSQKYFYSFSQKVLTLCQCLCLMIWNWIQLRIKFNCWHFHEMCSAFCHLLCCVECKAWILRRHFFLIKYQKQINCFDCEIAITKIPTIFSWSMFWLQTWFGCVRCVYLSLLAKWVSNVCFCHCKGHESNHTWHVHRWWTRMNKPLPLVAANSLWAAHLNIMQCEQTEQKLIFTTYFANRIHSCTSRICISSAEFQWLRNRNAVVFLSFFSFLSAHFCVLLHFHSAWYVLRCVCQRTQKQTW